MAQRTCSHRVAGLHRAPAVGLKPIVKPRTCRSSKVVQCHAAAAQQVVSISSNGASPSPSLANWGPESWKQYTALQQPEYPDTKEVEKACADIRSYPPLIFAGECRNLQQRLAHAATGEAFILFGGDCAEAFSQFSANRIRDTYRLLLQMSVVMMFGGGVPIVKLGRMAGQFAKPRSANMEEQDGKELPSYRYLHNGLMHAV
eukprot:jgi/Chrzof1/12100/Cz06g21110.t1_DHS1